MGDYDYQGPGVYKPHPRKNWVNPDATPVFGPDAERRPSRPPSFDRSGGAGPAPERERTGRSPLLLVAGVIGLIVLLAAIAFVVVVFVLD